MSRARVALCVGALVIVGSSGRPPLQQIEGTVTAFAPGESLTVVNDQTNRTGLVLRLRGTRVEQPETQPGARVKVSFRVLGERGFVAERVSLVPD